MFDKYAVATFLAPFITPIAPAAILINTLYFGMIAMGMNTNVALVSSIATGAGAELSGMVAAYAVVQAWRRKKSGHLSVGIIAFSLYVLFMVIGIWAGNNPLALIVAVFLSIIAYLGVAVLEDLLMEHKEVAETTQGQIGLTKAQASLERAKARQAEAGAPVQQVSTVAVHAGRFQVDAAQIERIRAYWASNPGASLRAAAEACQCSPMTAKKYKDGDK